MQNPPSVMPNPQEHPTARGRRTAMAAMGARRHTAHWLLTPSLMRAVGRGAPLSVRNARLLTLPILMGFAACTDSTAGSGATLPTGPLPPGWMGASLGLGKSEPLTAEQTATHAGGKFGLRARGAGIEPVGASDEHLFVYQKATGDKGITARVVSADPCGARASFGVIARPTLEGDSAYVLSAATGTTGLAAQSRVFQGLIAVPLRLDSDTPLPIWVRVERKGFNLIAGWSKDGTTWQSKSIASPFPPDIHLGLVASSHDPKRACGAVFDSVSIDDAKLPLPAVSPPVVIPDAGARDDAGASDAVGVSDAATEEAGLPDGGAVDASPRPPTMTIMGGGSPGTMLPTACNMLPADGPEATSKTIASLSPFPSGGALKEGIYFRVGTETYTGPDGQLEVTGGIGLGRGGRTVMAITRMDESVYIVESATSFGGGPGAGPSGGPGGGFGGFSQRSTARWTRRGSSVAVLSLCPQMGLEETITAYAVNGDDLLTFSVSRLPSGAPAVNVTRLTFQPHIPYDRTNKSAVLPAAGVNP